MTTSSATVAAIQQRLSPLKSQLQQHPLYQSIVSIETLRIFMESHVFAVWDFMSLLKSLQRALTVVEVPWVPAAYPSSCRFLNEIVLGEESDVYEGRPMSHFAIYLEAMGQAGASTRAIEQVLKAAGDRTDRDLARLDLALSEPSPGHRFARSTFDTIRNQSLAAQAAAFTFGREDAIPDMFRSLVRDLNGSMGGNLQQFVWYLERHIEVDGDDHGPLALRMISDLCGDDAALWEEAARGAEAALNARLALWDGILDQIKALTR